MSKKNFTAGLDSLFGEEKLENNKAINAASNKTIKPVSNKTIDTANLKAGKEKATFNLSKQLLQDLEDTWLEIRKTREDKKITKTEIVEFCIKQMITDFKTIKPESKLYSFCLRSSSDK